MIKQQIVQQNELTKKQVDGDDCKYKNDTQLTETFDDKHNDNVFSENECEMILHGITTTYKIRLKITNNALLIGRNEFEYQDIYKIEIGDISSFQGNVDKHKCMVLLTKSGTIQLEAPSKLLRDQWLRKIEFQYKNDHIISVENWNNDLNISSPTKCMRRPSFTQNYSYPLH
eukprot:UN11616